MINKRSSEIGASYFHEAETGHVRGFSLALGKGGERLHPNCNYYYAHFSHLGRGEYNYSINKWTKVNLK